MSNAHHPDCFHRSGAIPPAIPCPCRDFYASQQRVSDLKHALGDGAGWFDRCMAAERQLGEAKKRLTVLGSILIEAIGAEGPENADVTAGRAVERIRRLEWLINDHIGTWGICDSADDDGESLVCGSDQCSYCALVLAVGGQARHE